MRRERAVGGGQAEEPLVDGDLRALVERVPAVFYVREPGGRDLLKVTYVSPRMAAVLGYSSDELRGEAQRWMDVLHPADRERVAAEAGRAFSAGAPLETEYRVVARDGGNVWVRDEAVVVRDAAGRPSYLRGVLLDVTERRQVEEAFRESRARFAAVFGDAAVGIALVDMEGRLTESNPALEVMLGYGGEELRGMSFAKLNHPEDATTDAKLFEELAAGKRNHYRIEKRLVKKDGGMLWSRLAVSLARDAGGEPALAAYMVEDVTGRKEAEEALRRSERGLAAAQRVAHFGSWEYDVTGREARWSDEMFRIFGLRPGGIVPTYRTFLRSVHPDDRGRVRRAVREVLHGAGGRQSVDYRVVRPDGAVRHVHTQYEAIYAAGASRPEGLVGTVHDVTERKTLEERLVHQALHDPLTGLPNRTLFLDRLEHALARGDRRRKPIAVLFLDLDDFKYVNDTLGHEVGDRLLVAVAGRLAGCVRPGDTLARLGGDEFVVLLEEVGDASDAVRVAERISEALREPFHLEGHRLCTSASIGIVLGASSQDRPGDLLRDADLAMYRAKNGGKARYEVFDPVMSRQAARRLELKRDLRRALEGGEFAVLYQPKVRLETGRIAGMEALLRWQHPEHSHIPPSEFVPLAEEAGLMVQIGRKVLEEACRQARAWRERYPDGAPQTVYVNLSAGQFDDPRLIESVAGAVREAGVEPGDLALEIPESVLMRDAEGAVARLRALGELGVRVVVDDFGTAYSSLSHLGRFPMSFLNIDRSLVLRLGVEPEDTATVFAMIQLAHSLGWEVTAEGVENADQLARLRELGCDMAQGYHLWEPLTSEEASASLATDPGPH